jgi:hypothetical protein
VVRHRRRKAADVRELIVDLSHAGPVPDTLLDLMRRVETKVLAHNGTFELTGLAPPVLHAMDDPPFAELFARHRAVLDDGGPLARRCADRHRSFIDIGAPGRGAWWRRT